MTEEWLYSLFPALAIALLAILARLLSGSWTHPATFFPSVWATHALVTLFVAPDLPLAPTGLWWIALSSLSVLAGAFLTYPPSRKRPASRITAQMRLDLQSEVLRPLIVLIASLLPVAFISAYFSIEEVHRSLNNFTSFKAVARMAAASSVFRYSAKYYGPNIFVQFFLASIYLLPLLGGLVYALRRNWWHVLIACSVLFPALFVTMTQSMKAGVLISCIFWLSSYLTCTEYTGGRPSTGKVVSAISVGSLLLFGLVGTAEALRSGTVPDLPRIIAGATTGRAQTMAFGHMYVFTSWFDESLTSPPDPTFGIYTFAGPSDLLGLSTKSIGVYKDSKPISVQNSQSNVYTYYRGLIEDFTMPGALVCLFLWGAMGGWAFRGARESRYARLPWLLLYHAVALWVLVSMFTYNSLILAFVVFWGYWWILTRSLRAQVESRKARSAQCPA